MSSNISVNSGAPQIAPNSVSSAKRSGQSDGKFSEHLADATVDEKTGGKPANNGIPVTDGELLSDDVQLMDIETLDVEVMDASALEVEVPEIDIPDVEISDFELQEMILNDEETPVDTGEVEPVILKPEEADVKLPVDVIEVAEEAVVVAAVASTEVGKNTNATVSSSEGSSVKPAVAANARNVAGRRDGLRAEQGETENKGQMADEVDEEKPVRTMERPLSRTVGRGRAHEVIENRVRDGATNPGQVPINNAAKPEQPGNSATNAFGVRGAESRLASMMEASDTFDGDVKISMGKQENHMLPALPQQLTVTGMSRTLVSQVLELRRSGELETNGFDVKTNANKPVKIIEVQLMPRNLGTVGITIRNMSGHISISIEVQGAEAERLIRAEVDKIAGAIRQSGQVLEDITIKRGVQMSQQSDSLTGDHGAGRQGEANFGQNADSPLWQSSDGETDGTSNLENLDEIDIQDGSEIAASSTNAARQGIYL